jgi:hypothetical protein
MELINATMVVRKLPNPRFRDKKRGAKVSESWIGAELGVNSLADLRS